MEKKSRVQIALSLEKIAEKKALDRENRKNPDN